MYQLLDDSSDLACYILFSHKFLKQHMIPLILYAVTDWIYHGFLKNSMIIDLLRINVFKANLQQKKKTSENEVFEAQYI